MAQPLLSSWTVRTSISTIILLSAVLGITVQPDEAEACSPPLDFFLVDQLPSEGLAEVPVLGVVPILIGTGDASQLIVSVEDSQGTIVSGTHEFSGETGDVFSSSGKLIWSSDVALEPSANYQMTISSVNGYPEPEIVLFSTRSDASTPTPSFSIEQTRLREFHYTREERCCDEPLENSCGFEEHLDCYTTDAYTRYWMIANLDFSDVVSRYTKIEVSADSGPNELAFGPYRKGVELGEAGEQHCITITMTSLVDDSTAVETSCLLSDDVELSPYPELYDTDVCETNQPPVEPPVVDPPAAEPIGGCSTGSGSSSSALLLLLGGLLLFLNRRSRTKSS